MTAKTAKNEPFDSKRSLFLRISAILGFLAVALGAFGAHGLENKITDPDRLAIWDTAAFYHLVHAVMLYLIAVGGEFRRGAWICMAAGVLIFSGSLYVLVLSNIKWLGAITPIGGVLMLVGWVLLVVRPAR